MTENNTGEYPLRTLDEMRAARERGDEIYGHGKRYEPWMDIVASVRLSDLNTILCPSCWTARPRKPKEFDFFDAARKVWNGEAREMRDGRGMYYVATSVVTASWQFSDDEVNSSWTLIGNDGKPVYE